MAVKAAEAEPARLQAQVAEELEPLRVVLPARAVLRAPAPFRARVQPELQQEPRPAPQEPRVYL